MCVQDTPTLLSTRSRFPHQSLPKYRCRDSLRPLMSRACEWVRVHARGAPTRGRVCVCEYFAILLANYRIYTNIYIWIRCVRTTAAAAEYCPNPTIVSWIRGSAHARHSLTVRVPCLAVDPPSLPPQPRKFSLKNSWSTTITIVNISRRSSS